MLPKIGITCNWREKEFTHTLAHYYVRAVEESGGLPILIPTVAPTLAEEYYLGLDGLVFSGGADIDPVFFNEDPKRGLGEITPERDVFEILLARKALQGRKPILAICRGIQVINIVAGGDIYQDIEKIKITDQQHMQNAPRWYPTHQVEIADQSKLSEIIGKAKIKTNSFHHQAVKNVAQDFVPVAWTKDGLVEAIEAKDKGKFIIGVQWHPECCLESDRESRLLFEELIMEARLRKET